MPDLRSRIRPPHVIFTLIALAVLLPLLLPGHILTLDMALTPRLPMPDSTTSSYLFRLLLHVINTIIPTDVIEKLLLLFVMIASGTGMHRLVRYVTPADAAEPYDSWAPYIAGILYMINPYTYSRFMAGQYSVLLGYALLPFFVRALLVFLARPGWPAVLKLAGWTLAISVVSLHSIGLLAVVVIAALGLYGWRYRRQRKHLTTIAAYGAAGFGLVLVASSHWLVPLLLGTSDTAQVLSGFGPGDREAFATAGDTIALKVGHIIRLQGFWAETRGLYTLPQEVLPGWGLVALLIWGLVIAGGVALWRRRRRLEVALLGISIWAAILLASGLAEHVGWFPGLAGYREPHKFVGLVALGYAFLAGAGAATAIHHYQERNRPRLAHAAVALFLLTPVLFTPTMFWGFSGQLKPRHYPAEWFAMNERLNTDPTKFQVLFLPWHRYMQYGFAGRIIMNPADEFFNKPIIASLDPEYGDASPDRIDPQVNFIDRKVLPGASSRKDFGPRVAEADIKYILLAKEADATEYGYLDRQPHLRLEHEDNAFKLYYNKAWEY